MNTPAPCTRDRRATRRVRMRDGARAATVRADAPNPELVDMTRRFSSAPLLAAPVFVVDHGRTCSGAAGSAHATRRRGELDRPHAGDARRLLGRLAVLRARLGRRREPQPQHVHADRRSASAPRTSTASSPPSRPASFPAGFRHARRRRHLLRGRGVDHVARPARPGPRAPRAQPDRHARSASSSAWRRRRRADRARWTRRGCAARTSAGRRRCASARASECGRRRGRSTARAPSTSRWSPASRSRSKKSPEPRVTGGDRQRHRQLVMRAERVGSDTLLAQIVRMVGEAQRSRAPIQRLADQVAAYFVPAVVAGRPSSPSSHGASVGPEPRLAHALVNAVAVLIIACPCALGLATPMSIMVGTGAARTVGVLVKNARGARDGSRRSTRSSSTRPARSRKESRSSVSVGRCWAARPRATSSASPPRLERGSEHPLAAAIVAAARERGIAFPRRRTSGRSPARASSAASTAVSSRSATLAMIAGS